MTKASFRAIFLNVCMILSLVVSSDSDQSTDGLLDCSATRRDGSQTFEMGDFILLDCSWVEFNQPVSLTDNVTATPASAVNTNNAVTTPPMQAARPQLAWFRREVSGNISEVSANHERVVIWRLAADDNGIEFFCAPTNGTQILSAPTCSQTPLIVPPKVSISSSPGTHYIGEGNTFTCSAAAMPGVKTYEWYINGVEVFPDHNPSFSGDTHAFVDDENDHKHKHLTFDRLNATDNGTRISCRAWTTTGISNNASFLLIVNEKQQQKESFFKESVVLLACLAAGGAPVLFLICVCIVWSIRRSRRKKAGQYIDYDSGSFKSDENNPASETNASLQRHGERNSGKPLVNSPRCYEPGTASAAIQRPNFFRQKLNRLSHMFFPQSRFVDDESIYENTNPSHTTTFTSEFGNGTNGSLRGGDISRGGSLQLPNRPPLSKTMSTPTSAMSAPLARSTTTSATMNTPEQEYENFIPPTPMGNTPSVIDSPSSPAW